MPAVTVVGNISEPKLEYGGPQNKARCTFSIAENHSRFDKDKSEWVQTGTTWYRVTLWEAFAENFANEFSKGSRVIAEGRSYTRAYQMQDGTEGSSFELHVNNIGAALSKKAPENTPQGQSQGWGGQQAQGDPWGPQQATQQTAAWDTPQENEPPF